MADQFGEILAAQNGSAEDRTSLGFANLRPGDVASLPAPRTESDPLDDRQRIEIAIAAFDAAWNRCDRTALARRFAPQADFVDTAARWLQGRQVIANHIIDVEVPGFRGLARSSGVEKLTMLHPELAVVHLRWNLESSDPASVVAQGIGLRVAENQGQGRQILAAEDTLIRALG